MMVQTDSINWQPIGATPPALLGIDLRTSQAWLTELQKLAADGYDTAELQRQAREAIKELEAE